MRTGAAILRNVVTALLCLLLTAACTGSSGESRPSRSATTGTATPSAAVSSGASGYVAIYRGLRIPGWTLERYGDTDSMDVGIRSLAVDPAGRTMTLRLGITPHLPSGSVSKPSLGGMFGLRRPEPTLTDRTHRTLYRMVDVLRVGATWVDQAMKTPVSDGTTVDTSFVFAAPKQPVSVLDVSLQPLLPTFWDVPVAGGGGPAAAAWSGTASGSGGAPGYGFAGGSVPVVTEQKGMPIKGWTLARYTREDTVDVGVQSLTLDPGGATMTLRLVFTPRLVSAVGSSHYLELFDINGGGALSPGLVDRSALRRYDILSVTSHYQSFRAGPDDLTQVSSGDCVVVAYQYVAPHRASASFDLTVGTGWPPVHGLLLGSVPPAASASSAAPTAGTSAATIAPAPTGATSGSSTGTASTTSPTPTTPTPTTPGATAGPSPAAGEDFTAKELSDAVVVFPLDGVTELARAKGHTLTLGTDVLFDFGSSVLDAQARTTLDAQLARIPKRARVSVVGYTDSIGSTSSNLSLSRRRAKAVAAAMRSDRSDLSTTVSGRGESHPVADNGTPKHDNPAGRAKNRRVEISWKS